MRSGGLLFLLFLESLTKFFVHTGLTELLLSHVPEGGKSFGPEQEIRSVNVSNFLVGILTDSFVQVPRTVCAVSEGMSPFPLNIRAAESPKRVTKDSYGWHEGC